MTLRKLSLYIAAGTLAIVFGLTIIAWQIEQNRIAGGIADTRLQESTILAERLRQSADDMSRMARLYIVTRDSKYAEYYRRIHAIRIGEAPRPENYDAYYWYRVELGETTPPNTGKRLSLERMAQSVSLGQRESRFFASALAASNQLVDLEQAMMDTVRLRSDAGKWPVDTSRELDRLTDAEFANAKIRAISKLSDFEEAVTDHFTNEQRRISNQGRVLWYIQLVMFAMAIGLLTATTFSFIRRVLYPLLEMSSFSSAISKRQYSQRLPVRNQDEIGILAGTFNNMAEAIESDIDRREKGRQRLTEANTAARTAREELDRIINSMPGNVYQIRLDQNGKPYYSHLSQNFEEIIGLSVEPALSELVYGLSNAYPEHRLTLAENLDDAIRNRQDFLAEWRLQHPRRGERWVRSWAFYRESTTGAPEWNGTTIDITHEKALMTEVEQARDAAESANRAKSGFLANMSHEIRTPMNAIIGMAQLTLATELSTQQRHYIQRVDDAAHNLLRIINDILDFSKIEADKLEIENIDFPLDDVLNNLADIMGARALDKNLELAFDIHPSVTDRYIGDPLRLGQVLLNLASNAIKFTEQGEVVVSLQSRPLSDNHCELEFSVRDTGIGMSGEETEHLFESFTQADSSTTRRFGGTGLGLAISKRLVTLMGGRIWVTSELEGGSDFRFTVPLKIPEECQGQTDPNRQTIIDMQGPILVVDDNETSRIIIATTVQQLGVTTATAQTGEEALEKLRQQPYSVIMLDWDMPGLSGVETARAIRQSEEFSDRQPRLIMITAYGRDEVMREAIASGIDSFLVKPVNPSLLFNAINATHGKPLEPATDNTERANSHTVLRGRSVLLAEDNEINQEVACEILQQAGIQVTVVDNGAAAVKAAQNNHYDAILMDCQMPVMDGFEATQTIRNNNSIEQPVIIAMTANAMAEDRQACLAVGMNDHLAKPIDIGMLLDTLCQWIPATGNRQPPQDEQDTPTSDRKTANHADEFAMLRREALARITGLDLSTGLSRLGQNDRKLSELLLRFSDHHQDTTAALTDALQSNDHERLLALTHELKGTASNLALSTLAHMSQHLHAELEQQEIDPTSLQDNIQNLCGTLNSTTASIKTQLASITAQSPQSNQATPATREDLEKLHRLIAAADTTASDFIDALSVSAEREPEMFTHWQNMKSALRDYNFDTAQTACERMLESFGR